VKRGDSQRLSDIASAIATIRTHLAAKEGATELKRDAILYNLLIIGEAVKALTDETRAHQPDVPWRQIGGLRDLIAHEYFRIDMREVQRIVDQDLAPLDAAVAVLRKRE
jgi:uncharacterized protein with HEPN domain